MEPFNGWPPEAPEFFRELEHNNNREWFHAHRDTYDRAVRGPLEALLGEVQDKFGDAKVFRPNRDIRFSADKTPYKTQIYAVLSHPGGGGWYVALDKDGVYAGGGCYSPDRQALAKLRGAISADEPGERLEQIVAQMAGSGLELMTEGALKRAPKGYPVDHPRIHLLRLPHLAAVAPLPAGPWLHTREAKTRIVEGWNAITPLLEWLALYL